MNRRINISLPDETLQLIDQIAPRGDRSRFIAEAVNYYVESTQKAELRQKLKEGAIQRAERDLNLAEEWFFLEDELY